MAGKRSVSNVLFEHQTEALPAIVTTARVEGDTIAAAAANNTVRNSNQCQILYRSAAVTGTQAAINRAGVAAALGHQMAIMSRALKRDVEKLMLGNSVVNTGADGTARTTAGILAKLSTNVSKSSAGSPAGANPTAAQAAVGSTARTDAGTARAFTEALLKAALKLCFDSSGDAPTQIIMSSANKQLASAFSGRASSTQVVALPSKADEVQANVSVYIGDFGTYAIQADRFIRGEKDVLILNPEYVKIAQLRAFETKDIGRTGDAQGKYIVWEGGLQVDNELAHGLLADCSGA